MSKCPAEGKGSHIMSGLLSGRCLAAVLIVAVLAVSCFVLMNESDDSSATNAQRVYITLPGGDDPTTKHYLEDGDSDNFHSSEYSVSYNDGVLSLHDSSSNEYSFYDCYNIDGVGLVTLYADGDLVLEISGSTPELRFCTYSNDTSLARYGIYVTGNLTIRNTGDVDRTIKTLNHSSIGTTARSEVGSTGIYCGGTLTIQNNSSHSFTIDANASDKQTDTIEAFSSFGIRAAYNITVEDTILNVSGGKAISTSAGIYCGNNLSVTNTKFDSLSVTASGSDCMNADATSFYSYGIYAGGNVSFTDVSVTATGGQACKVSAGIHSGGTVSAIRDKTDSMSLQATGSKNIFTDGSGRGGYSSFGIDSGYISFRDVDVTATAADITNAPNCSDGGLIKSIGINCLATTDVNVISGKATVTATGGSIDVSTYKNGAYPVETAGMHVVKLNINLDTGDYSVTSAGGDVYFQSGGSVISNKGGISYGIFASTITNMTGRVTADGGIAFLPVGFTNVDSYGIYSAGSFTGNGCKVVATASDASKVSCGIYAGDFNSGVNSEIECNAGFVPGQNGKSIGLYINNYIGGTGSNVVCRSGIVCYPTTFTAGIWATDITLNGDAVLEGYGGSTRLKYVSESGYNTGAFNVPSGSASDSYGVKMFGNITVNGASVLKGVGGEIITQAAHGNDHCTYGIGMNPAQGDYTISGTGSVIATGGETKYGHTERHLDRSVGLSCGGNLGIAQATVTATGGTVCKYVNPYDNQQNYNGSSSIGLEVASLFLTNSANVTVCGGDNIAHGTNNQQTYMPYYNDSYGAYIDGSLSVSASTLNATAGKASRMAGLYVVGGITVTGNSNVDAFADSSKREGYVRDDSNGFSNTAYGIAIGSSEESADITVTDSILMATGGKSIQAKDASTSQNKIIATYIAVTPGNTLTENEKTFASIPSYSNCVLATYKKATVTFNGNGGGGTMEPRSELGRITLPSCGFTAPSGKTFAGWAINDPSGTLKSPGSQVDILLDTVFYAVWNDVPRYDVSFIKDEGITLYIQIGEDERRELTSDEITAGKVTEILSGTTVRFTAQSIAGYDVYYQIADSDDQPYIMGTCALTVTNDSSITFTKVPQKYTITWRSQDGSSVLEKDIEVEYGTTLSYDSAAPTKENTPQYTYEFVGWALEAYSTEGTLVGSLPTAYSDMTYYAAFSATVNTYTVTWKSQDGNTVLSAKDYDYGQYAEFDSADPTKENTPQYTYEFVGWATSANQTTGLSMVGYPYVTGDVTYYAAFSVTVNKYTVIWMDQDGTVLETDEDVEYGTKPSFDAVDPVKDNTDQFTYAFVGWAAASGLSEGTAEADLAIVSEDVIYYAAYSETVNKYTATFDLNGGSVESTPTGWTPSSAGRYTKTFDFGTAKADIIDDFGSYSREGYSETSVDSTAYTMGAAGMTITVNWEINQYAVTVNLDGGTASPSYLWAFDDGIYTKNFDYGTSFEDVLEDFGDYSREGYFKDDPTSDVATVGVDGMRITAHWTVITYRVDLNLDGGAFADAPDDWAKDLGIYHKSFDYNTPYATIIETIVHNSVATAPAKEGYTFTGWSPNTGNLTTDPAVLTAQYSVNKYTATFDLNGGSVASAPEGWSFSGDVYTKDFNFGTSAETIISNFGEYTRTGFDRDTETTSADTIGTDGMTITAQWLEHALTVTFDANGGTGEMSQQVIKYSDAVKTLKSNAFVKTRYHFTEWKTVPSGSGTSYANERNMADLITSPNGTLTLYAQWAENSKFTVTFDSNEGSAVVSQLVYDGEYAERPTAPEKVDFVFAGWYTDDGTFENAFVFETTPITADIELYAKWDNHEHQLEFHAAVAPTCTQDGNVAYWQCTQCGTCFSDSEGTHELDSTVDPATGHEWGAWTVTVQPTCTAKGTETRYCENDHSHTESQDIDMIPHTLAAVGYQEATCTEPGHNAHWVCSVCGKLFSDSEGHVEIAASDVVIPALGHDLVPYGAQEATCTEPGWDAYDECSRCDYTTYHEIAALGHAYSATYEWSADGKTCTVHIICARDAGHNHDVPVTATSVKKTDATFSAMGVTTYSVSGTYDSFAYAGSIDIADIPYAAKEEGGAKTYEDTVPANTATDVTGLFDAAKEANGSVEVITNTSAGALTIAFDGAAVSAIGAATGVTLKANVIENSSELPDAKLVIEVTLAGATFSDGKAKVSIPFSQTVPEGKEIKVYFINGSERTDMNATLVDGKVVFETNHFSTYAVFFEDSSSSSDGSSGGFPIWVIFVIIAVVAAAGVGAFFVVKNKKA